MRLASSTHSGWHLDNQPSVPTGAERRAIGAVEAVISIQSDFFRASTDEVRRLGADDLGHDLPGVEAFNINPAHLASLRDVCQFESFGAPAVGSPVLLLDEGLVSICPLDSAIVKYLGSVSASEIGRIGHEWARTDEWLGADPAETISLLNDLSALASEALSRGECVWIRTIV